MGNQKADRHAKEGDATGGVYRLIETGMQAIDELAEIYGKVSATADRKSTVETDNAVKMSKAETDAQKEDNRHREQLAKLEQEMKRISNSALDREATRSLISMALTAYKDEYDLYLSYDRDTFLDETTSTRLGDLRKVILELTKELLRHKG